MLSKKVGLAGVLALTISMGILFVICLAAKAVKPNLIGVYLELRAQKHHDAQQIN